MAVVKHYAKSGASVIPTSPKHTAADSLMRHTFIQSLFAVQVWSNNQSDHSQG